MTTPSNCEAPACIAERKEKEAILTTKMNGLISLSLLAVGLLSYSVFWQAPNIKESFNKEVNRLDKQDVNLQQRLDKVEQRVSILEAQPRR